MKNRFSQWKELKYYPYNFTSADVRELYNDYRDDIKELEAALEILAKQIASGDCPDAECRQSPGTQCNPEYCAKHWLDWARKEAEKQEEQKPDTEDECKEDECKYLTKGMVDYPDCLGDGWHGCNECTSKKND